MKTPAKSPNSLLIFTSYGKVFYFEQHSAVYILIMNKPDTVQAINLAAQQIWAKAWINRS